MRFSIINIFVCLLLAASLSLNWYLIQKNGLDDINEIIGTDFELPQLFSEKTSENIPKDLKGNKPTINEPTKDVAADIFITHLQKLFEAQDYTQAWKGLSERTNKEINILKNDWLNKCRNWLEKEPNSLRIDDFIAAGLNAFPGDYQLRLLDAKRMFVRQKYIEAIDELYALLAESDVIEDNELDSQIINISQQRIKYLTEQQEWQALFEFTERLLWHDKTNVALTFIHAEALTKLERYSEAKNKLYYIADDVKYGSKAKALIDVIDQTLLNDRLDRKSISLLSKGSHHIVSGLIDDYVPVNLMIDTGASLTTISESAFNKLQQSSSTIFIKEQEFNTAGGLVTAPIYQVSSFRVDEFSVSNIEIAVMDLETGSASDGLLGMNFLSNFDFKIDQQQNVLILAPRN